MMQIENDDDLARRGAALYWLGIIAIEHFEARPRPSCTESTARFRVGARRHSQKSVQNGLSLCALIKLAGAAFAFFVLVPQATHAQVPVEVIRFEDVKPAGAVFKNTFEAVGVDPQERVYLNLCNGTADCYLLRYDPKTNERQYLGSLYEAAKRAGNIGPNRYWPKFESITKGHTHIWYLDGKMWMATMGAHGYEDMSVIRGSHFMAYDIATGVITDHAQWQPKGALLAPAGAGQTLHLQLHQAMGGKADHLAQKVGVGSLLNQCVQRHHVVGHRSVLDLGRGFANRPYTGDRR